MRRGWRKSEGGGGEENDGSDGTNGFLLGVRDKDPRDLSRDSKLLAPAD